MSSERDPLNARLEMLEDRLNEFEQRQWAVEQAIAMLRNSSGVVSLNDALAISDALIAYVETGVPGEGVRAYQQARGEMGL